jgi:hypothetical protein
MGCSLFDLPCHITTTVAGWWAAIPLDWLFWGVFGAGLVLGAILGKWGVAALIGGLALFAAFSARTPDRDQTKADGNNAKPNGGSVLFPSKARPKVRLRGKRVYDPDTDTWKDS